MSVAADLASALDPVRFATEALGFTPDPWQRDALRSSGRRALWCCCRQSGKSTTASILALHEAAYRPGSLTLLVSPSLRQSSELFRKVADFLHRLDARPDLVEDNKLSLTLTSGSRVVSLPSSEETVRGFSGVGLLIEDEAARVSGNLYRATRPFLATTGGRHILMSSPFGKRGHFWAEWDQGGPGWERVRVTAHQVPRISPAFLEEERRALGDLWYRSEYLAEFVDAEGSVFRHEDIQAALSSDVQPLFGGRPA